METISFRISDVFPLGRPETLPESERELSIHSEVAASILQRFTGLQQPRNLQQYLCTAKQAMKLLPSASKGLALDDPLESQENRDNDIAFGIERHHGDCVLLLLEAVLNAAIQTSELVERNGTNIPNKEWAVMQGTVEAILQMIANPRDMPVTSATCESPKPLLNDEQDPLRRWMRGHLLFMVICQGMSLSTKMLIYAAEHDDRELAKAQANQLIQLMNISRITLKFATDLTQKQYLEKIRPTLMPPLAPPKMSGINWRDHMVMIKLMRKSTPAWDYIERYQPDIVDRMRSVLSDVYEAHRNVCEQFVGENNTSLLARENASTGAGKVIEGLKTSRLKLLQPRNI